MKTLLMIAAFVPCMVFAHGPRPAPRATHIPVTHQIRRPMPPPPPRHYHSTWGRGGCNFWPGFTGALVGFTLVGAPPPPPRPLVYVHQVWIPPVYEWRPVYDAYGRFLRNERILVQAGYWR